MISIYVKKKVLTLEIEFNSHRTGLEHHCFIAWNTNMTAVTSCENALLYNRQLFTEGAQMTKRP